MPFLISQKRGYYLATRRTSPPEGVARYCFDSVYLSVCPANILVFYLSAIRRDFDLKFIQDTYRVVLHSLTKIDFHRSNVFFVYFIFFIYFLLSLSVKYIYILLQKYPGQIYRKVHCTCCVHYFTNRCYIQQVWLFLIFVLHIMIFALYIFAIY